MEKNIVEMLEEEKEYINKRGDKKDERGDWNIISNRRSTDKKLRSSSRISKLEYGHTVSTRSSTKKKISDRDVSGANDNDEFTSGEVENNEEENDFHKKNESEKVENKSSDREVHENHKEKQMESEKKEDLKALDRIEEREEETAKTSDSIKREMGEEFKSKSNGMRYIESLKEEKKKEKKEGTNLASITLKKTNTDIKHEFLNKNESASAPVSIKKGSNLFNLKQSILKSLNSRASTGSSAATAQERSKSIEIKKQEGDETVKHVLDVLAKRVLCLTTMEFAKENEYNNFIKYRLANKEGLSSSINKKEGVNTNTVANNKEAVLLLLTRDFRVDDNWALTYAYELANKKKCNLLACTYFSRKEKQYNRNIHIKLKILKDLETNLKQLNIPFHILTIYMIDEFVEFVKYSNVKTIVCDFNPLKCYRNFITNLTQIAVAKKIKVFQVDSHNIIPVWVTSTEEEINARSIRKKIKDKLNVFLTDFVKLKPFQQNVTFPESMNIMQIIRKLTVDTSAPCLDIFEYTESKALQLLKDFCNSELEKYCFRKNDPNCAINHLLPLLVSLGILSSQRCALQASQHATKKPSVNSVSGKEAFYDQIIIKKELAENFCYFNKNYDNMEGSEKWARETLEKHETDKREYLYEYEDLREAKTHDDIWNCSQLQLIKEGLISGHLKLYWAKQILNWTSKPKEALEIAFELYKHFSLDGASPMNCEVLMNAIFGVHDISCTEKAIVGKVRHMSNSECKKRFNAEMYMCNFSQGVENAILIQKIPTITFATYLKKRTRNSDETKVKNTKKIRNQK